MCRLRCCFWPSALVPTTVPCERAGSTAVFSVLTLPAVVSDCRVRRCCRPLSSSSRCLHCFLSSPSPIAGVACSLLRSLLSPSPAVVQTPLESMRSSLLVLGLVACLCVSSVSAGSFADPDDAALMEIGVDLSAEARAVPTPTFTFDLPANHREPLMAKFPLVHEIQGVEAQDWKDIQGLLTREPQVAEESSVDMKLDELEEQFNRIDAKSTAAPTPAAAEMPRMAQVGAAPGAAVASAAAGARGGAPAAAAPSPATLAAAQAALAKLQAAAKAVRPPRVRSVAAVSAVPTVAAVAAVSAAPAVATAAPAAAPAKPAADSKIAAQTTARLIEKRLRGLTILFKRFKAQTGMDRDDVSSARVEAALKKQKTDAAALKKRLAKKGIVRFAQQGQDEDSAFVESQSEAELESEVESEAQVAADAEAIDDILDTLM